MNTLAKSISSQPDAAKFRSIVAIVIVLICISSFLSYTDKLSEKAEEIARERVVTDINHSLAMMLYDYTIKGKRQQLKKFDKENPFIPLAIYRSLPLNYQGSKAELTIGSVEGWYYERKSKKAVFIHQNGKRKFYVLTYMDSESGSVGSLLLKEN